MPKPIPPELLTRIRAHERWLETFRSEYVLGLFPEDARVFVENLVRSLESPEKEAPHLYQAIKHNNV